MARDRNFATASTDDDEKLVSGRTNDFVAAKQPLRRGFHELVSGLITTGRLPGAPKAHQQLADYVEYAQAVVNQTITVAEAITATDLRFFALGLPVFAEEEPRRSNLNAKDVSNLACLERCLAVDGQESRHYHVSSTYHASKLLYVATSNPRACEWLVTTAIMVQRGLGGKVTEMLLRRKDRFVEAMQAGLDLETTNGRMDPALIAYNSTLERVIVSMVTSMKSLHLGQLGPELKMQGDLPDRLDLDCYVTGDPQMYNITQEATALGLRYQKEVLFIEPGDSSKQLLSKRPRHDKELMDTRSSLARWQRIEILATQRDTLRYQIVNQGPTGRIPHAKLVSGFLHRHLARISRPGQREKLLTALQQPGSITFTLETDLATGIADICVNDDQPKGMFRCPALSVEGDLPGPANIASIPDILPFLQKQNIELLDFGDISVATAPDWTATVLTFLVVRGWWWSKHLINNHPDTLLVPSHLDYFSAMASLGATMLHLEQDSGCTITTNMLFDDLRMLTNIGSTNEAMTNEALTYAAQGPGGTLVHDVLGSRKSGWSVNPYLRYRWLRGKFMGVPETALFGQGCEWRKEMPTPASEAQAQHASPGCSITIFADSTDGHTLRCAVVDDSRSIKSLPYSRVLCGHMMAYIGCRPSCGHRSGDDHATLATHHITQVSGPAVLKRFFGSGELREEEDILIHGLEDSRISLVAMLGVSKAGTAIDTRGCIQCAFERASHVIQQRRNSLESASSFHYPDW